MEEQSESDDVKLSEDNFPKKFHKVGKYISVIIILLLPFVGFILGVQYSDRITNINIEERNEIQNDIDNKYEEFEERDLDPAFDLKPGQQDVIQQKKPTYLDTVEENKEGYGIIEGSLSYPSEYIPDQTVCAEQVNTGEIYCTKMNIYDERFAYGKGYEIQVPEGLYVVYSVNGELNQESGKIYYSDFVICGFYSDCPSHNPIEVYVSSGKIVTDANPQDWYK